MARTPIEEIKQTVADLGLDWNDVRDAYRELRRMDQERQAPINEVRNELFTRGPSKAHPAFWRGDQDLSHIENFDVLADGLAEQFAWLNGEGDPARMLFEIGMPLNSELVYTDEEAWQDAIALIVDQTETDFPFGVNER